MPNMIVMAPKDENELRHMLWSALAYGHPASVRFPKAKGLGVPMDAELKVLPLGRGRARPDGRDVLFAFGHMVQPALEAAEALAKEGLSLAVVDARFVKPLDADMVLRFAGPGRTFITLEEGVVDGGAGSAVRELLDREGRFDVRFKADRAAGRGLSRGQVRRDPGRPRPRRSRPHPPDQGIPPDSPSPEAAMKERADKLLAGRGLAPSREKAQALIMAGLVTSGGRGASKSPASSSTRKRRSRSPGLPFVGRGGLKLEEALERFGIDVAGKVALDIGASTGGFIDCLFKRGAARVYAVDVDTKQIDWSLGRGPAGRAHREERPVSRAGGPPRAAGRRHHGRLVHLHPQDPARARGPPRRGGRSSPSSSPSSRPARRRSGRKASSATRPSTPKS